MHCNVPQTTQLCALKNFARSKHEKMREFSIQLKCLKFIGFVNVVEEKHKILLRFFQRLNILIIFYCLFAEILFVLQNFKDVFATAECLSYVATELITCAKIITFYCYNQRFGDLIASIKEMANKGGCFR